MRLIVMRFKKGSKQPNDGFHLQDTIPITTQRDRAFFFNCYNG